MNAALDTLQVTKDLKAASFSEAQAEALAKLLRDRQEAGFSLVATKADVSALGSDLRRELADAKSDLLKWMVTLMLGQVAVIAALVKLL